jgi:hypothetical protein
MKKRKRKIVVLVIVLVGLLTGGGVIYADGVNGFLDWTGSDELDNAQAVITELVSDIVELDSDLQSIEAQLDAWILEDGITAVELDLDGNGDITTTEKITVLKALSSSAAGGQTDLLLEVAALEAELVTINQSLDLIITNESITVVGTETANEKILLIESYIAELDAEIIWLNSQLEVANSEAEAFEEGVCTALDDLPSGLRGNYDTWCPTP